MIASNSAVRPAFLALFLFLPVPLLWMPAAAIGQGSVWGWGANSEFELGGGKAGNITPLPVEAEGPLGTSFLRGIEAVSSGNLDTLTLRSDGTVWGLGDNFWGELGDGQSSFDGSWNSSIANPPVQVSGLSGAIGIAAGYLHSLAVKDDGTVWAWGDAIHGDLGDNGSETYDAVPVQVADPTGTSHLTGVAAVAAGDSFSLALKSDGTVWAWGYNEYGQCGPNASGQSSNLPVQVGSLTGLVAIAAGGYHGLALKNDGTVWAWGENFYGELGDDSTTISSTPVRVSGLSGIVAIAGGQYHSLAVKDDGTVWAWGYNEYGQLGNGMSGNDQNGNALVSTVPVQVSGLSGVLAVAGGWNHSLAVKGNGTAWAWGDNEFGQLGNGQWGTTGAGPIISSVPVQVSGLTGVVAVAGSESDSLAIIGHPAPSVALISSSNPATVGLPITFTATVSSAAPGTGAPTGTITFLDGTTTLGTVSLANGTAAFSTSTLSSGSQTITASYSGDSTHASAQASLAQVIRSAWIPTDISVGADNLSRVLWSNPDGRAVLWSLNRTTGNYTQGPVFGPYDGGAWHARRIACGKDGISRIVWSKGDGTLSLWFVDADNTFKNNVIYGPFAGWAATDISVGSDNKTRILWTDTEGQALVWSVDSTTGNYTPGPAYGPYTGYTAVALACGSDGLTRLVWANPLGIASLWIMDAQNVYQSFTIFGPYTGWIPTDMDVGSDNLARLLWTSTVDGRAIVWSVDSSGNPSDNTNFYGPYAGYAAQRVACGSDGYTRLTWLRGDGVLSFSHMSADNTMLTFNIYGPYF